MNALLRTELSTVQPLPARAPANAPAAERLAVARLSRRERDFGIGYGRSSGYGCTRRYTSDWAQIRFRCA